MLVSSPRNRIWRSALGASLFLATAARSGPPHRIVSLDLCADQLVVALADPGQIAALTELSRDVAMSAVAARAAHLPVARGGAESLLALRPDLVLVSPWGGQGALAAAGGHVRVVDLPPADSYAQIRDQVLTVAAAVGHPQRGRALVARMDAALAAVPRLRRPAVAAYYQRRGYMTGTGTLVDGLMRRVGLTNLAARLGRPALSRVSLEEMVAARPDYLIVETGTDRVDDEGSAMLHHRALAGIKRLRLPEAWTVCGGPAYVLAAESLARQLGR